MSGGSDKEKEAIEALARNLRASGSTVSVVRRPDKEERTARAVDFEIAVDGQLVAVEITDVGRYTGDFVVADQFEIAVEDKLRPAIEREGLGLILLRVRYFERLRKREIACIAEKVATTAIEALRNTDEESWELGPFPPSIKRVGLSRIGLHRNEIGRMSAPIPAYWVTSEIDEFVRALVEKKATQGVEYDELWFVVRSVPPLWSARDFVEGLARLSDELPSHWRRVYFLEGANIAEVFRR